MRTVREPKELSFAQATGRLIRSHVADLAKSLKAVTAADDEAPAHAARIRAKRLRYLLEPHSRRIRGVKPLVERLRQLQDLLGNLHDLHVMIGEIDSAVEALSRNTPDRSVLGAPGLAALKQLADTEAEHSFAAFRDAWADGRADRFLSRTNQLGSVLQKPRAEDTSVSPSPERVEPVASNGNRLATRPFPVG